MGEIAKTSEAASPPEHFIVYVCVFVCTCVCSVRVCVWKRECVFKYIFTQIYMYTSHMVDTGQVAGWKSASECVCVCECVCACMWRVCLCKRERVCLNLYAHKLRYMHIYVGSRVSISIRVRVCVRVCVCVCVCLCVCVCVCIYTQLCMYLSHMSETGKVAESALASEFVCVYVCACVRVCLCVCVSVYLCVHMHSTMYVFISHGWHREASRISVTIRIIRSVQRGASRPLIAFRAWN